MYHRRHNIDNEFDSRLSRQNIFMVYVQIKNSSQNRSEERDRKSTF